MTAEQRRVRSPSRVAHVGQAWPYTLRSTDRLQAASRLARPFWPLYLPLWPFVPPSRLCSRTNRVPLPPSPSFFRPVASSSRLQPLKLHSLMRSTDPQTGSSITPGFLPLPPFCSLTQPLSLSSLPTTAPSTSFSPFVPLFRRLGSLRFPLPGYLCLPLYFVLFLQPSFSVSLRGWSVSLLLTISLPTPASQLLQPPAKDRRRVDRRRFGKTARADPTPIPRETFLFLSLLSFWGFFFCYRDVASLWTGRVSMGFL